MTDFAAQAILANAKAKFSTDRGAVLLKVFRQKNTLRVRKGKERIKKRICGSLDGISSVKVAEKVTFS